MVHMSSRPKEKVIIPSGSGSWGTWCPAAVRPSLTRGVALEWATDTGPGHLPCRLGRLLQLPRQLQEVWVALLRLLQGHTSSEPRALGTTSPPLGKALALGTSTPCPWGWKGAGGRGEGLRGLRGGLPGGAAGRAGCGRQLGRPGAVQGGACGPPGPRPPPGRGAAASHGSAATWSP